MFTTIIAKHPGTCRRCFQTFQAGTVIRYGGTGWTYHLSTECPGSVHGAATTDKPLAIEGLTSYRYRGRYGWIMIGATDHADALREASRSTEGATTLDRLQVWTGAAYQDVVNTPPRNSSEEERRAQASYDAEQQLDIYLNLK